LDSRISSGLLLISDLKKKKKMEKFKTDTFLSHRWIKKNMKTHFQRWELLRHSGQKQQALMLIIISRQQTSKFQEASLGISIYRATDSGSKVRHIGASVEATLWNSPVWDSCSCSSSSNQYNQTTLLYKCTKQLYLIQVKFLHAFKIHHGLVLFIVIISITLKKINITK
jgi:hypothetical protein